MKRAVSFVPQHRLSTLLRTGGGVTAAEALARASQRVESLRERALLALDGMIEDLAAESASHVNVAHIYAGATEIYSLAGTFSLVELAEAARSLSELIANHGSSGRDDLKFEESVRVHVDAMRTLRKPELSGDSEARVAVVHGLRRVAARNA